ncbi:MAG: sodium-dependent transporter [Prevotella sp.]|nr:sodium-dependent transporter [Prevotella sp.]
MEQRGNFGTKIGVILATAGSAVGLGNIWRFPYMTGQNGGAAFIILYLLCVVLLGIPGMLCEFIIGRHGASNAARAYAKMSQSTNTSSPNTHHPSSFIGYLGVFTSMIILGFYAVVAGWCLQYLFASLMGHVSGDPEYVKNYFLAFSSNPLKPTLWAVAFILITHLVVIRGVRGGIEKASNLLMPTLFVLLIIIVAASCMLPGASKGVEFLLKPDFSKLNHSVFLEALGQAFFSLSLGTACLCTYASYFSRQTNLLRSAVQIALIDSAIAILAGLMIFPAAFSVGVSPDSGPSLIFITLPNVFQQAFSAMPVVGYVVGILFYGLLSLAALTSTISMHEIGTAFFYEELHVSRRRGAWVTTLVCSIIAVFCSLSMGAVDGLKVSGMPFLDFCDYLTAQYLLPLGSFLTCLFLGWYVPKQILRDELTNWGTLRTRVFPLWLFAVRYVCPLCIAAVFLHQFGII